MGFVVPGAPEGSTGKMIFFFFFFFGEARPVKYRCEELKKVQVGKDQDKAQSEKDSHSKNRGGKKTKLTIRYYYHETYCKPNEQLFSQ